MANNQKENSSIMVTIYCITYNHGPYIRQCLDGFVMQKTNFGFEAIVHDDASLDDTREVIREYAEKYPEIIKPIFETENQYSKIGFDGIFQIMNEHTRGKYIAFCEGDDYWVDECKLQKQVDILENYGNVGLVFSKVKCWDESERKHINIFGSKTSYNELLFNANTIPTLTVCLKKEIINNYYDNINPSLYNWKMADYPMWLYASKHYDIYFIDEIQGIYRILEESASHSKDINKRILFENSCTDIRLFFCNKYNERKKIKKRILESHILSIYKVIIENNGDKEIIKDKLKEIGIISWKIIIFQLALKNKFFNYILKKKLKIPKL